MKKFWKYLSISIAIITLGTYLLFLALPLIINPVVNNYTPQIKNIISESLGLNSEIKNIKFLTTPKLTTGIKIEKFSLLEPNNSNILNVNNFQVKMSLIPLLAKRIEVDLVCVDKLDANILIDKDGNLVILKYFPTNDNNEISENSKEVQPIVLPFNLKLSNHLPNMKIGNYNVNITDGNKEYKLLGNNTEVSDFILNKSIKVKGNGKFVLKNREQFNYDIKINNHMMPELELQDLVFNPAPSEEKKEENNSFELPNIIEILDKIYENNLTCNAKIDMNIENDGDMIGKASIHDLSILNLPASFVDLKFKGNSIDILSDIYTAKNEVSKIDGLIKTGKHPNIDLNLNSKVELANILRIIKEIALIFDIKDLQTLSANGKLDANFNIKSNLKTVKSNGYLNIPNANLNYGLYNVAINNINTDIKLDNNNIDIKNMGFTILNEPFRVYGTISSDAVSDLHIKANNMSLKGLLIALGQGSLLKDNQVNSGLISLQGDIVGKLDKIKPVIKINLANINIKNIPANTSLVLPSTSVNITSDGKTFGGNIISSNLKVLNPCANISVPSIKANLEENEISISETPVKIDNINLKVNGKIKNYLTEKITLDFNTFGDIKSKLSGDINLAKQTLNLNYFTTDNSSIIIPMFNKSRMNFTGNISILGNMMNPIIKGTVNIPTITIPEIPVSMNNLLIKLDGPILKGSGSVDKFTSGGIVAENLTSDFKLKGNDFYLTNLKGSAFDGKINGNIIYNLVNAKTNIVFSGSDMNATKAIEGASGIKNAISGTLGFDTKMSLRVLDYNEMMKSLKGNLTFNIQNGAFGTVGRFDRLLQANNIMTNAILKTTVSTITNTVTLTDTLKFDYLDGTMSFNNGWADIKPIKSSGRSLAYYVTGKYNLLNGTTNIVILGRLDSFIISKLGLLGEITADKILAYIPKLGPATTKIIHNLTTTPKDENVSALPQLTSGRKNYKDFKVVYNGGIGSVSSVKSFKWIANVDTSAIEGKNITDTAKDIGTSLNKDYQTTVNTVKDIVNTSKDNWNVTKEDLKNSKEQFKNDIQDLKNMFKF